MSTIWRKNFEIMRSDLSIAAETIVGWYNLQAKTLDRRPVSKTVWVYKDTNNPATYVPKQQLKNIARQTLKAIIKTPSRIDRVHKKTVLLNQRYFDFGEKIRKMNLTSLTDRQLLKIHGKLYKLQLLAHCYSLPTTWSIDSDRQTFSNHLYKLLQKKIKGQDSPDVNAAFSLLTTPHQKTLAAQEEEESLKIAARLSKQPRLKRWFMNLSTSQLQMQFATLPSLIKRRLLAHHYKWCWMPYTYQGPAYGLDYYLEVWRGLLRQKTDGLREIQIKRARAKNLQRRRQQLIAKLKLTSYEKHLFGIAADVVWVKGFRKDCYFHGFFCKDMILAEIGRRAGLSLLQVKFILPQELPKVLKGHDFINIANERMKFMVVVGVKTAVRILTGPKAEKFLKKLYIEKLIIPKVNEFIGTCACPGRARGKVRVINLPEEMAKMNSGDIMIAHATYPALVPAMKKAAAVATEEGGITCHAAIVSRELQIPCVVGIKTLLQILKDGDQVEVDANKGVVRKI